MPSFSNLKRRFSADVSSFFSSSAPLGDVTLPLVNETQCDQKIDTLKKRKMFGSVEKLINRCVNRRLYSSYSHIIDDGIATDCREGDLDSSDASNRDDVSANKSRRYQKKQACRKQRPETESAPKTRRCMSELQLNKVNLNTKTSRQPGSKYDNTVVKKKMKKFCELVHAGNTKNIQVLATF